MSTAIAKNFQVGADPTPANNFTIRQPVTPDGTVRIANGNSGTTTDLVTLTSAGNLGVGTSSPISFATQTSVTVNGSVYGRYDIRSGGTHVANWYSDTTISGFGTVTNIPLLFTTNNQERMRIDSSGNVGIGTSSPNKRFSVGGASTQFTVELTAGANDLIKFDTYNASAVKGVYTWSQQGAEAMRIDSSGNLLVGTTSVWGGNPKTEVRQTGIGWALSSYASANSVGIGALLLRVDFTNPYLAGFYYGGSTLVGTISTNGSSTTYGTSSDYRLKNTIAPMTGALAKVAQLKPVTYKWNSNGSESQGFIAHELQEIIPEAVTGEKDGVDEKGDPKYQNIDTSFLVATLTAAIQELKAEFDAYKATHP
jgi:hypothetical protein